MKTFDEVIEILRKIGTELTVDQADEYLSGVVLKRMHRDGFTLTAAAARGGWPDAVAYLGDKGVPVDVKAVMIHPYHLEGAPLFFALLNSNSDHQAKLSVLRRLIEQNADLKAEARWREEDRKTYQERTYTTGNLVQFGLAVAAWQIPIMNGNAFDEQSRDILTGLQMMLPLLRDAGVPVNEDTAEALDEFLALRIPPRRPMDAKTFLKQACQELKVAHRVDDSTEAGRWVCDHYLSNRHFQATPEWARLIRHLVDQSLTFEEVTEEVYGEEVAFDDDEGGLCQGWAEYNCFGSLTGLLTHPSATVNAEWADLLVYLMANQERYNAGELIEDPIATMLAAPWAQSHHDYDTVRHAFHAYLG